MAGAATVPARILTWRSGWLLRPRLQLYKYNAPSAHGGGIEPGDAQDLCQCFHRRTVREQMFCGVFHRKWTLESENVYQLPRYYV